MKTEYTEYGGFLQRDGVEHKEYAGAYSTESQQVEERDGADLHEKVLDRDDLNKAYKRVKGNKGASGVDGMTVEEALSWLKEHGDELLESIRNGKYKPSPVRRVEIPKDNGGERKLGIPTVIDRMIQQAIAQVLTPIYEPKFSDGSYGYRPHRSAKDAIRKVKEYADDIILLAKSIRAAERLLGTSTQYLEKKLKLKVNMEKSRAVSVYSIRNFGFLALRWEGTEVEVTSEFTQKPRRKPRKS